MIKFKCNCCGEETSSHIKGQNDARIPSAWITIEGEIYNEHYDRKIIHCGKTQIHLCSKMCVIKFFFKTNMFTVQDMYQALSYGYHAKVDEINGIPSTGYADRFFEKHNIKISDNDRADI